MESAIVLRDGRSLAYAEYGAPRGTPLFYFHGFPGSRLEACVAAEVAERDGARIIAVDRPGMGGSTFQPHRRIPDWADDVRELADHLSLERFAVLGVSGGGPYALSCACRLADRLTRVVVVGGVAPLEGPGSTAGMLRLHRIGLYFARGNPARTRRWFAVAGVLIRRHPEWVLRQLAARIGSPDREVLCRPGLRQVLLGSMREAARQGSDGLAMDLSLYARPWGLDLSAVTQEVLLWYGERDRIVPAAMGRRLALSLGRSRLNVLPAEGHFSLIFDHLEEILREILAIRPEPPGSPATRCR